MVKDAKDSKDKRLANLDLGRLKGLMANAIIVDGRNVFDPAAVRAAGFEYYSLGRK